MTKSIYDKTITRKDWKEAGSWSDLIEAREKQGYNIHPVTEEIYDEFLCVLPPEEYGKTRQEFSNFSLPITNYFLVGEASNSVNGRLVYATFVRSLDKYWFIGYLPKQRNINLITTL